jgi:hypothetical protein
MQRRMATALVVGIAIVFSTFTVAYAWPGDTWGPISRATMEVIATDMISPWWTPKNTINNLEVIGKPYQQYNVRAHYQGVAYSQGQTQENLSEFITAVKNTPPGITEYGNDCSGFVSMVWKLPKRYTTKSFEDDVTNTPKAIGDFVTSRGNIGSAKQTILLSGDALVKSEDHMVLFKDRIPGGILTMEQTPHNAKVKEWTWGQLSQYRPIRRKAIDETLYTGSLPAIGSIVYHPNASGYYSAVSGTHSARFGGPNDDQPNSTQFHLHLEKWNDTEGDWKWVRSGRDVLSSSSIEYRGTPGYYRWRVFAYRGSGNYELSAKVP